MVGLAITGSFSKVRLNLKHVAAVALSIALVSPAQAQVLFEGYSKIILEDTPVGYAVQRFEFDPKKKEFSVTSFVKTNAKGGNVTESTKARATDKFKPLSYTYTGLFGEQSKTIDASFKGDSMTAMIKEGGKSQTVTRKIPSDAFFSNFLFLVMLQGKEGMKTGVKYTFKGLAEEDGNVHVGEAFIASEETMNGVSTFKILVNFAGAKYVSYVTSKGELVASRDPMKKLGTDLVASMQEATAGQQVNSAILTHLFGSVPKGAENVIARRAPEKKSAASPAESAVPLGSQAEETPPAPEVQAPPSAKKQGVPGGQGIIIKGQKKDPSKEPRAE